MGERLPFEIREAVVSACGKLFWLKDPFREFLISCGVSAQLYDRYADESKYKIIRHVLAELDDLGDEGYLIQRRIVTQLASLHGAPDENVQDKEGAKRAIAWLGKLAQAQKIISEKEQAAAEARGQEARRKQAAIAARSEKMMELRSSFASMVSAKDDPQARGYSLEDLLAELFEVHEIPYRRPYRTSTEQIDGHFKFREFDYLVEARWRTDLPSEADLAAFKTKVDKKIASTRGLFFSINGFRADVVLEFTRGVTSNIVLMDGSDLALILEGHISLVDALEFKIQKAAQEGIIFYPLAQRYSS